MYCTGGTEMLQSQTCMAGISKCHWNSIRNKLENSLHQKRTHAEWFFSHQMYNRFLPHAGNRFFNKVMWWNREVKDWQLLGIEPKTPAFCNLCCATELWKPDNHHAGLTILYLYYTAGTEMQQSYTWQPLSMCRWNTGVNRKILSIRREPMPGGFLIQNGQILASCFLDI